MQSFLCLNLYAQTYITTRGLRSYGEDINLVNNFKVEKVIFNCGKYNDLEIELIKALDKKRIKYYSCIKKFNRVNITYYSIFGSSL